MSVATTFDVARVTDRLLVGGAIAGRDHAAWLAGQGVTDVISAAVELSDRAACARHHLGYRHVLWYDDKQLKPLVDFARTLEWVRVREAECRAGGGEMRLYVHCAMGINRGPLLAVFLLAALEGIAADEAWAMIKRVRPHVESFDVPAYRHSCLLALAGYTVSAVPESLPPHVAALYRRAP
jgi:hypothetical protein